MRCGCLRMIAVQLEVRHSQHAGDDISVGADPGSARRGGQRQVGNEHRRRIEVAELQPDVDRFSLLIG